MTEGAHIPPAPAVNALIDTCATTTGIASALAAHLQMQPIGIVQIHGVGGLQNHNSYLFRVAFPFAVPPGMSIPTSPGATPVQLYTLANVIQGCEFKAESAPFQVLLGMDVISTGSLVVQGNGTFSFSF